MRATAASKSLTSNHSATPLPIGSRWIGQVAVVVGDVGAVQLQNQFAVDDDLLVLVTAVAASLRPALRSTRRSTPARP